ncbi:hypothetical protein ACI3EY_13975 [Ornithinimicrobium sp. LYQ92]|uniref:hypothetical protein n=1 Tax=Serinicoccus sp. LYQ92 TaxID=3378798 RepID=UPI0038523345
MTMPAALDGMPVWAVVTWGIVLIWAILGIVIFAIAATHAKGTLDGMDNLLDPRPPAPQPRSGGRIYRPPEQAVPGDEDPGDAGDSVENDHDRGAHER